MSTHNLCFDQYEKNQRFFFLSENSQFLEVKFSIYLNRRVFVMDLRFLDCQRSCLSLVVEGDR